MPKLLELCCGENSSWSVAAKELGFETTRLDWDKKVCPDICCDVRDLEVPEDFYDVICASPDCRELSRARSWKKGDVDFTDSVVMACARLCQKARCLGVLENPLGAVDSRECMKEFEADKHIVDYCMYSGSKPDDFVLATAHKQQLHDWFPYRKRSTIYTWSFGPTLEWLPRPLCNRVDYCKWKIKKKRYCRAQHSPKCQEECKRHCLPGSLSTAQEHSIPRRLCLELLGLTRQEEKE